MSVAFSPKPHLGLVGETSRHLRLRVEAATGNEWVIGCQGCMVIQSVGSPCRCPSKREPRTAGDRNGLRIDPIEAREPKIGITQVESGHKVVHRLTACGNVYGRDTRDGREAGGHRQHV